MKAVLCTGYGAPEVLQINEVARPEPGPGQVRVKVQAAAVTAADTMMRRGTPAYARLFLGLTKPKQPIPGTGFAGVVDAVGDDVTNFGAGDPIFGETGVGFAAHAEYVCVPHQGVVARRPEEVSAEHAACLCDGPLTSLNFLQQIGQVQPEQRVLINGAAGSLGTAAVQLAALMGAEVTGVCIAANRELVESLGAQHVIDYTREDFTAASAAYDVIYDTVGKSSFARCKRALAPGGTYLSPVLSMRLLGQMLWTSKFGRRRAKFSATGLLSAEVLRPMLDTLIDYLREGRLKVVIDRRYALDDIVEAHRYVDTGHKRGNVVLTMPTGGN